MRDWQGAAFPPGRYVPVRDSSKYGSICSVGAGVHILSRGGGSIIS